MRVLTVALVQNESKLVRHFVRHYRRLGDVRIYDDHSADGTASAAAAEGAAVIPIADVEPYELEARLLWVKNHSWKQVRDDYDWIIAVDGDEFLYHENLPEVLRHSHELGVPVLLPCGYEIASYDPPQDDIPVTTQMRRGAVNPCYSKPCCFCPGRVDDINMWGGAHHATPSGSFHYFFPYPGLKLLHYRYLGVAWVVARLSNQKRPWSVDAPKLERDIVALDQRSSEIIPEGPLQWFEGTPDPVPPFVEAVRDWAPQITEPVPVPAANGRCASRISTRPMGRWFLREPVLPTTRPG
jgi:hypothetical protein